MSDSAFFLFMAHKPNVLMLKKLGSGGTPEVEIKNGLVLLLPTSKLPVTSIMYGSYKF